MYRGTGRQHSPFNGAIWDVYHYEKDLDLVSAPGHIDSDLPDTTPGLAVEKNVTPVSIKQGTDARITITLVNQGTTPVHDIEVVDETLPEFPVSGGDTRYAIPSGLQPGETRSISYMITGQKPGRYVLNGARVLYAGEDGNYHRISSGTASIVVLEPLIPQDSGNSGSSILKRLSDFMKFIFP